MSFNVLLRTNRGEILQTLHDPHDDLEALLSGLDAAEFPYLGLVDPYGDTLLSGLQMQAVIPEIHRLRRQVPHAPAVLDRLEHLAEKCAEETHAFLVFVGD